MEERKGKKRLASARSVKKEERIYTWKEERKRDH